MSDKAEKKPDAAPASAAAAPVAGAAKKGGIGAMLGKTPVMLGGVMILEALVLFAGIRILGGGPQNAGADVVTEADAHGEGGDAHGGGHGDAHGGTTAAHAKHKTTEIQVLDKDFKAQNKQSGRTFLYDVSVYVVARTEVAEQVKETIKAREALIKDRIRTIIAQNDPEKLGGGSEPGLETLRRQVKHQLDEIIGDGMIEEVLVPRCIPFRTDF